MKPEEIINHVHSLIEQRLLIEGHRGSVRKAMDAVFAAHPGLREQLRTAKGRLAHDAAERAMEQRMERELHNAIDNEDPATTHPALQLTIEDLEIPPRSPLVYCPSTREWITRDQASAREQQEHNRYLAVKEESKARYRRKQEAEHRAFGDQLDEIAPGLSKRPIAEIIEADKAGRLNTNAAIAHAEQK